MVRGGGANWVVRNDSVEPARVIRVCLATGGCHAAGLVVPREWFLHISGGEDERRYRGGIVELLNGTISPGWFNCSSSSVVLFLK
jgi:hypothetical protein